MTHPIKLYTHTHTHTHTCIYRFIKLYMLHTFVITYFFIITYIFHIYIYTCSFSDWSETVCNRTYTLYVFRHNLYCVSNLCNRKGWRLFSRRDLFFDIWNILDSKKEESLESPLAFLLKTYRSSFAGEDLWPVARGRSFSRAIYRAVCSFNCAPKNLAPGRVKNRKNSL